MNATSAISTVLGLWALLGVACTPEASKKSTSERLPQIAPATNYGKGVSALAAGEIDRTLIVAGGANFPDTPAAEGGKKRFYDQIYILAEGSKEWQEAGVLPKASAYGAVYALDNKIIIAGGSCADGSISDVVELALNESDCCDECCDGLSGTSVVVTPLQQLPVPVEQAAAAKNGEKLYLAGGLTNGAPSLGIYSCDIAGDGEWRMIAELPEPMVQPIAAATERNLYVWGGFDPVKKEAANYGFRYDIQECTWSRIEGLPDGGTAVGSTAVQDANGKMWVVGGVNRDIFNHALNLAPDKIAEYQSQPVEYYRFRTQIMTFDPATETWATAADLPAAARAGAAVVLSPSRGMIIINGEEKPGIRSAEATILNF